MSRVHHLPIVLAFAGLSSSCLAAGPAPGRSPDGEAPIAVGGVASGPVATWQAMEPDEAASTAAPEAAGAERVARPPPDATGPAGASEPGTAPIARADRPIAPAAADVRATAAAGTMVLVPAGTFTMGSPEGEPGRWTDETARPVTLTRPFFLQTTEVTQAQWREITGHNSSYFKDAGDTAPVETVTWWEAAAYANAVSAADGLPPCYRMTGCAPAPGNGMKCAEIVVDAPGGNPYECAGYRLPTEAEWEMAYRAGTSTAFYNGPITHIDREPADPNLLAIGWYSGNSGGTTHPVAQKQPNALGLFDLPGNVWEWTWDWFGAKPSPDPATDPLGPSAGRYRTARGGSWNSIALYERAAARGGALPDHGGDDLGFRLARTGP